MMPTRSELRTLARTLRQAHAHQLPIELAERIQRTIVRIEDLLVSPIIDPTEIDDVCKIADQVLDECYRLLGEPAPEEPR